jgi:hypothetical protein
MGSESKRELPCEKKRSQEDFKRCLNKISYSVKLKYKLLEFASCGREVLDLMDGNWLLLHTLGAHEWIHRSAIYHHVGNPLILMCRTKADFR